MKQASKDTRERAVKAYKNGISIAEICKNFGICRKTLYTWRKIDEEGGEQIPKPKGRPPKILTSEDLDNIKKLYEDNNSLFLRKIPQKLGLGCSLMTIYRAVKSLGLTFKKSLIATEQNREDVKKARTEWFLWQKSVSVQKLVFLDESGIRTNITMNYG